MTHTCLKTLSLALGVSSTCLTAPYAFAAPNDTQQTIQQLRQQLNEMQARLERLENQAARNGTAQQQGYTRNDTQSNNGADNAGEPTVASNNDDADDADDAGLDQSAAGQAVANQQQSSEGQTLAQENSSILEELQQTEIGGTLEFAGTYNDWEEASKDTVGDLDFGKFILAVDGEVDNFLYSLEYRFYDDYRFLKHGWLGYKVSDNDTVKVGLVQTPFGNLEYGYLGFYGNLPYLSGFNDNQNAGIKWDHDAGAWTTSLAFFKSDQLGNGNEHYGANPVGNSEQGNSSENQLAGRIGYTFGYDTDYATEVAFSAKGGQLYNERTNDSGDNWSAALSMDGSYGNWRTLLQATAYEYHPKNPDGVDDDVIQLGSFNFNYPIPVKGQMYSASLGYSMDVSWGPITNVYFFNDFSYISPDTPYSPTGNSSEDPMLNDAGVLLSAGPYYAWFDIITEKNALGYIGPADDQWHTSLQTHFGVQF